MNHIFHALQPLFDQYGYFAVFLMIFLEDFGLPTPGETTLVIGSLMAARGGLSIFEFALIAWFAAILGDNVGYAIGRFAARSLILQVARRLFISKQNIERAEGAFRRFGPVLVIIARFVDILRQLNGIIAGMAKMPWRRFLAFNTLGAALWVTFWATLSYELGRNRGSFGRLFQRIDLLFLCLFALMAVSFALWRLLTRERPRTQSDDDHSSQRSPRE